MAHIHSLAFLIPHGFRAALSPSPSFSLLPALFACLLQTSTQFFDIRHFSAALLSTYGYEHRSALFSGAAAAAAFHEMKWLN